MTVLSSSDSHIAGTVKFDASIPIDKLISFIVEMRSDKPEQWVDLHVRGAGDDGTHYIAFHYIMSDGSKKTHEKTVQKLLQYLEDGLAELEA